MAGRMAPIGNDEGRERRGFEFNGNVWPLGHRTYVMGVLNVTPDSFSDGGRYVGVDRAVRHAAYLVENGADMIDLGGESTRPGHRWVDWEEEWERVGPVLQTIKRQLPGVPVSVDTRKSEVARRALDYGADVINDVEGFVDDAMLRVVAASSAGLVMMFNRHPPWDDGLVDIAAMQRFLAEGIVRAEEAGIASARILVDPGLGFGYGVADNWRVLRELPQFRGLGAGLLIGPSRKRFLGQLTGRPADQRDWATAAVSALGVTAGVDVVRVHAVREVSDALKAADCWVRHG